MPDPRLSWSRHLVPSSTPDSRRKEDMTPRCIWDDRWQSYDIREDGTTLPDDPWTSALVWYDQCCFIFVDSLCVESCSTGYYTSGSVCKTCDTTCANCTGPSSYHCTSCVSGKYFYEQGYYSKLCVDTCPTTYYPGITFTLNGYFFLYNTSLIFPTSPGK